MINYDSILSAFDGKPTLLQWLKMVKKALDESILKNVDITQNGEKVVFTFNFEDGTSISTPEVTLPKGDKGDKGDKGADIVSIETTGSAVVGVNTESTIRVELSDGSVKQFKTYAKNGSDGVNGNDGVSITGINTVGSEVVGDETLTTLRAHYSNNATDDFVVTAKNGISGGSANIYTHSIKIKEDSSGFEFYFNIYSTKEALTFDDVFAQIPVNNYIPMCFHKSNEYGIFSIKKTPGNEFLNLIGASCNSDKIIDFYNTSIPKSGLTMTDVLLGVNL